jgi:PAS domain S-box-containing protein
MSTAQAFTAPLAAGGFAALVAMDQSALDTIPCALYVCSADGTIVRYNSRAAQLWGRSPDLRNEETLFGAVSLHTMDGDSLPQAHAPMARALRIGAAQIDQELVIKRPDGSRIAVLVNVEPLRSRTGAVQGAVCCFQDITGRKRTDALLAAHVDELAALNDLTDRLYRAGSAADVYDAAMTAILRALRCTRSSILLFDASGVMRFVAWRGLSDAYRRAVEGHSPWVPGEDPQPMAIDRIDGGAFPEALRSLLAAEGIGALAFIPLRADAKFIGKFMAYWDAPHAFTDAELNLAVIIGRQLALILERARAEDELRREREVLKTIVDRIPVMITRYEPDKNILHLNPAFERIIGWTAAEAAGTSLMEACYPDPQVRKQVAEFMDACSDAWMDIRMRTRDGRDVETTWANIRLSGDTRVGIGIDISERKRNEQAARQLALIVQSSDDAIVSKDLNGTIVSWNQGAERLFGYSAHEVIGKPITILIPADRQNEEPGILARIRRGERIEHYETIRQRKDGTLIDISLTVSPIKDGDGRIVGASKIARDITERKRAESQRDLLVAELNHRVKNTLATVISIAHLSFAKGRPIDEAKSSFDSRIRALAQTHTRLSEANWSGVSLETILRDETMPYQDGGSNVQIAGPDIILSPKCALSLGLAIHELATNAAKYGALSTRMGSLRLTWSVDPLTRQICMIWLESGGPIVAPPKHRGFGRALLERALGSDLNGQVELDFGKDGLKCLITFPLDEQSPIPIGHGDRRSGSLEIDAASGMGQGSDHRSDDDP